MILYASKCKKLDRILLDYYHFHCRNHMFFYIFRVRWSVAERTKYCTKAKHLFVVNEDKMSDAPVEKSNNSSLCLTNSEKKIATLKERLSQDQSNKVNGTNGSSHNSEKSIAKMSEIGNKLKDIMTNGISAQSSSANLSNLKSPFNMSSKSPSQANGKTTKGQMHAPSDSRVNIGGKISLPAGMSVTPLGNVIFTRPSQSGWHLNSDI